jgi:hypothetical protein
MALPGRRGGGVPWIRWNEREATREAHRPKYRACDSPCDRAAASCDNGKPQPDIGKRPGLPHAPATRPLQ